MLPHRFPFQFVPSRLPTVDSRGEATVAVRLSHGTGPLRGLVDLPPTLGIEIVAQAAAACLSDGDEAPEAVFLAGCEVEMMETLRENPMTAGDELQVVVRAVGGMGRLRKVAGRIERDGEPLMGVELLLSL